MKGCYRTPKGQYGLCRFEHRVHRNFWKLSEVIVAEPWWPRDVWQGSLRRKLRTSVCSSKPRGPICRSLTLSTSFISRAFTFSLSVAFTTAPRPRILRLKSFTERSRISPLMNGVALLSPLGSTVSHPTPSPTSTNEPIANEAAMPTRSAHSGKHLLKKNGVCRPRSLLVSPRRETSRNSTPGGMRTFH